ncbi:spermatid-specific protein T2-like [Xenia sp. Carnegie-2017]|uniref:spermatid-specific protein T2-like n=1 Tax=Xenia sp. Carnegie-2017 TaxID=2897299 RepID=UPI001F0450AB|nr:spermatid-specific protein T2-like [Xenia sp. Carnegie-2017]
MKITYLLFAFGLLCTVAYAATIQDDENFENAVLNESDEETSPEDNIEKELKVNNDQNELSEDDDDLEADPTLEKRSPFPWRRRRRRRHYRRRRNRRRRNRRRRNRRRRN